MKQSHYAIIIDGKPYTHNRHYIRGKEVIKRCGADPQKSLVFYEFGGENYALDSEQLIPLGASNIFHIREIEQIPT